MQRDATAKTDGARKVSGREAPNSGVERGPGVEGAAPEQKGREKGQEEAGAASRIS